MNAFRDPPILRIFSTDAPHFSRSHTIGEPTAGGP